MRLWSTWLGEEKALTLLMVHGWGSSANTFAQLQRDLSPMARTIAVDLRGFGRTGPVPAGRNGFSGMVADLAELVEATGPVVAIGHSMGGTLVSRLTIERPELVRGSVVIDPSYGAGPTEVAGLPRRHAELIADPHASASRTFDQAFSSAFPEEKKQAILQELMQSDPRSLLESFEDNYLGPDALGPLPQARRLLAGRPAPVLALYPSKERALVEMDLSPRSTIRIAPGPGHYIHLEHPVWTASVISGWLREEGLAP